MVGAPRLEHGRSRPLQVTEVQRGPPGPCGGERQAEKSRVWAGGRGSAVPLTRSAFPPRPPPRRDGLESRSPRRREQHPHEWPAARRPCLLQIPVARPACAPAEGAQLLPARPRPGACPACFPQPRPPPGAFVRPRPFGAGEFLPQGGMEAGQGTARVAGAPRTPRAVSLWAAGLLGSGLLLPVGE